MEEKELTCGCGSWHEPAVKSAYLSRCIKSVQFSLKDGRGGGFCQENIDICSSPMARIPRSSHQMWVMMKLRTPRKDVQLGAGGDEQMICFMEVRRKDNFRNINFIAEYLLSGSLKGIQLRQICQCLSRTPGGPGALGTLRWIFYLDYHFSRGHFRTVDLRMMLKSEGYIVIHRTLLPNMPFSSISVLGELMKYVYFLWINHYFVRKWAKQK